MAPRRNWHIVTSAKPECMADDYYVGDERAGSPTTAGFWSHLVAAAIVSY